MSRPGMGSIIATVRELTGAGTADFSDDSVQRFLDESRDELFESKVVGVARTVPGSVVFEHFDIGRGPVETGTAAFTVTDGLGGTIGTADYSLDAENAIVTFDDPYAQSSIYVTCRIFDPYDAGASLLEAWAAQLSISAWDLSQDAQTLSRRVTSMLTAARRLRSRGVARFARYVRRDG
jgi:hypothetical protein